MLHFLLVMVVMAERIMEPLQGREELLWLAIPLMAEKAWRRKAWRGPAWALTPQHIGKQREG